MFATTILFASVLVTDGPVSVPCGLTQPIEPQHHGATYDCAEAQDQGYDQGNPFEITVVTIDGEPVEKDTANAFWVMREAAAADGVQISINSGFRTMAQQEYFYMCGPSGCCCCNDCNLAASPGYSNHQSGHALDLSTGGGAYEWLAAHGGDYGFTETVAGEPWHWEWWGGGPGGGICDIAAAPAGTLDASACTGITGWAQDPDTPEASIDVHVYFGGPAGDVAAVGVPMLADLQRDDLCEPLGTCNHGFDMAVPLSLQDGAMHPVHVYAIDSAGAANAEIAASPQQLQCPRPEIPDGVRRAASADTITAWGFSTFWRMAMVEQTQLDALEQGTDLGSAPLLVRTESAPEIWWVDAGWRRHVPDPEIAAAWGLDLASAQIVTDAILDQWREGTPMRAEPTLVSVDGITIYLVDDAQNADGPDDGPGDSDGEDSGSAGDDTGDGDDDGTGEGGSGAALPGGDSSDSGCGCNTTPTHHGALAFGLLVLGVGTRRRRI